MVFDRNGKNGYWTATVFMLPKDRTDFCFPCPTSKTELPSVEEFTEEMRRKINKDKNMER
jgi:hypothetical protein